MRHLRAYVQLVRLPAVFTAMADIFAGYGLTHSQSWPALPFLGLLAASSALYLAGMVLNDVFDRKIDAVERPGRPIPSGRVSMTAAAGLAGVLIAVGLAAAAAVSLSSLKTAMVLLALILAYDGVAKATLVGPFLMGGCRTLNVLLGASGAAWGWQSPQLQVAVAMGIYVAGITWFARREAERSTLGPLAVGTILIDAGLLMLALYVATGAGEGSRLPAFVFLAAIAVGLRFRILRAVADPSPANVQTVVKSLLLAIILLDATIVFFATGGVLPALATLSLVVPAVALGWWISLT